MWRSAVTKGSDVSVVVWLGFAAFIGLGLPEATLGVTWPSIRAEMGRPLSSVGILLAAITVGYLPSSALSGRIVRRLGAGRMLAAASAIYVLGLLLYLVGPSFWVLVGGSVMSGAAAGLIDPGLNAHFAIHHGTRAMNLLHASFGVGATLGPFVATVVLGAGASWRVPYAIYAAVQLSLLVGFLLTRDLWSVSRVGPPATATDAEVAGPDPVEATVAARPRSRRHLAVGVSFLEFFLYTGLEVGTGVLAFTLLTEARGVADGPAGLWTSTYWASLTAGRLLLGVLGARLAPEQVLRGGTTTAVAATTFFAADPVGLGAFGLPVLGMALAGIFPGMVLLTPRRVGADRTPGVVGIQLSLAAVGASGVPALLSRVAEDDLERIGWGLVVLAIGVAVLDVVLNRMSRTRTRPVSSVGRGAPRGGA